MRFYLSGLCGLLCYGCSQTPINVFTDAERVRIAEFQDRRLTDSLLSYLTPTHPYRGTAALAFASVQDTTASPALVALLLNDKEQQVQVNAAFALGQTGGMQAAEGLIRAEAIPDSYVRAVVLEALGKVISKKDLMWFSSLSIHDSLTEAGYAWGLYRVGVRGLADSLIANRAAMLLPPASSFDTRLAAAHFFNRTRRIEGTQWPQKVISLLQHEPSAEVRMPLTAALGKVDSAEAGVVLRNIMMSEPDERVRVNAMLAAGRLGLMDVIWKGLEDAALPVRIGASIIAINYVTDTARLQLTTNTQFHIRVKANLLAAAMKNSSTIAIDQTLQLYGKQNAYGKAQLLDALANAKHHLPRVTEFVFQELSDSTNANVVRSSAAQSLIALDASNPSRQQQIQATLSRYESAIAQGDAVIAGIIASALADSTLGYRDVIKDYSFLERAISKLSLPRDYESYVPLENALAFLQRRTPRNISNAFNHPIDWKLVKTIPSLQRVAINTTQGEVVIRLLVDEAPGSVANFVQLVNAGYFNDKAVHRVVPNFVIQTGCNRGDGYGSEDYSIRSEFSRQRYVTGAVGMASAGKDTEGTQWFITHSPTPHLEGVYTLFALTEKGYDVVNRIQVGDSIKSVRLIP